MDLWRVLLIIIISSFYFNRFRAETDGLKREQDNLSTHLKTIDKLISNLKAQRSGPSFKDLIKTSVKNVKSMVVKLIDEPSSPISQRPLMLEAIKDLQKVEDYLVYKSPMIGQLEVYCSFLIEKNLFKEDLNSVISVDDVLRYIEVLNFPDRIDKEKLKKEIDSIIVFLTWEARHNPEVEKLADYLQVEINVINGVIDMDIYIESSGYTIEDMYELRNMTRRFAPLVDKMMEHKGAVKQMNSVYSSVMGKNFIENAEEAKKMTLMMKLEILSSMEKVKREPTKWTKLIEELKRLGNLY